MMMMMIYLGIDQYTVIAAGRSLIFLFLDLTITEEGKAGYSVENG